MYSRILCHPAPLGSSPYRFCARLCLCDTVSIRRLSADTNSRFCGRHLLSLRALCEYWPLPLRLRGQRLTRPCSTASHQGRLAHILSLPPRSFATSVRTRSRYNRVGSADHLAFYIPSLVVRRSASSFRGGPYRREPGCALSSFDSDDSDGHIGVKSISQDTKPGCHHEPNECSWNEPCRRAPRRPCPDDQQWPDGSP